MDVKLIIKARLPITVDSGPRLWPRIVSIVYDDTLWEIARSEFMEALIDQRHRQSF